MSADPIQVELWYPRVEGNADRIVVGLMDVRAASDITVTYDFDRDGWVILQDECTDKNGYLETVRENVEVAFIPAWRMEDERHDDSE